MKKLLAVFLVMCMVLPCTYALALETEKFSVHGDFEYTVTADGVIITRCRDTVTGEVEIPETIEALPVIAIADSAFEFCADMTSVKIPNTVETIGDFAFVYCWSLTDVTLPDSVESVGGSAFETCMALKNVNIGSGVSSIGIHAFAGCESLENITVSAYNTAFSAEDGVLYSKDKKTLVLYPAAKAISVSVRDGVEKIGVSAFDCARVLTSVTFPDTLTEIDNYAFNGCAALETVVFSDRLERIGESAFNDCELIRELNFPATLKTMGANAFSGCSSLTSIVFEGKAPTVGENVFGIAAEDLVITCTRDNAASFAPGGEDTFMGYPLNIIETGTAAATLALNAESALLIKDGFLLNVNGNTTAGELVKNFVSPQFLTVENASGTAIDSASVVGTGYRVVLKASAFDIIEFLTVAVAGDVTGDAKVNSRDIASVQRHIMETALLENANFFAGDVSGDSSINSRDLARIQRLIAE